MFYRVANLPIEKVCIIKNFEEANFSDFKRLVVTLKINPQKYNWPQKICKPLSNKFPGSNCSVIGNCCWLVLLSILPACVHKKKIWTKGGQAPSQVCVQFFHLSYRYLQIVEKSVHISSRRLICVCTFFCL